MRIVIIACFCMASTFSLVYANTSTSTDIVEDILAEALAEIDYMDHGTYKVFTLIDVAHMYFVHGNQLRAEDLLKQALEVARGMDDFFMRFFAIGKTAVMYAEIGYPEKALEIVQEIEDPEYREDFLISIGHLVLLEHNISTAQEILEQIDAECLRAELLAGISSAQAKIGDTGQAQESLDQALEIARSLPADSRVRTLVEIAGMLDETVQR